MVGTLGFEPTTCRLSDATEYKPAALPLSYVPSKLISSLLEIFEIRMDRNPISPWLKILQCAEC